MTSSTRTLFGIGGYGLLAIVQTMISIVAFVIMVLMLRKVQWNPKTEPTIEAKKRNILSLSHVRDSVVNFFKTRTGMNHIFLWVLAAIHLFYVLIGASLVIAYPYQYTRYLSTCFSSYFTFSILESISAELELRDELLAALPLWAHANCSSKI